MSSRAQEKPVGRLPAGFPLQSLLYGVEPHDPITLVGVVTLVAFVSLLVCWLPTARALSLDPAEALRAD